MSKARRMFGVISASTADTQQREMLIGMIETTQTLDIDLVVLSNIYNPAESTPFWKQKTAFTG